MNLYEQVVDKVQNFLPKTEDADRFVARQCRRHLQIEPAELKGTQIPELAKWITISSSLLIPRDKAIDLGKNIEVLTKS